MSLIDTDVMASGRNLRVVVVERQSRGITLGPHPSTVQLEGGADGLYTTDVQFKLHTFGLCETVVTWYIETGNHIVGLIQYNVEIVITRELIIDNRLE